MTGTRTFAAMHGGEGGTTGIDDDFAARGFANVGAWILGRNMFGPMRGAVARRRAGRAGGARIRRTTCRSSCSRITRARRIAMEGGTTFHFVTDGIHAALERAREAAGGQGRAARRRRRDDPAVPAAPGSIDEMHLAISPVLLGRGEHLLRRPRPARRSATSAPSTSPTSHATHVVLTRA